MNHDGQHDDEPMVYLAPDNARTARAAGIAFARSLAGAPSAWFVLALDEQEGLIHLEVQRAGYPERKARLAASAFDSGARAEWERIISAASAQTFGTP